MDNFIVSARKYRPQTFDTVVGQQSITNTLKNAIRNNHLAQAFLFCGPRGVGKTTCARILAKTINCEHLTEDLEACNQCESCTSFNQSASFNIHELDAASNNSVEDIRNLVDRVRIPPQVGNFKVYIIDEVHMLSPQAFNAFLKTLEEPPAYAKFILATTEKHKIIPTILSRCQIYDFKRITIEDIAAHLRFVAEQEGVVAEPDALHVIAQKSDGALRDSLSIFDQIISFGGKNITYKNVIENLNVLDYDYFFRITDSIVQGDISTSLLTINQILDNGFDGQHFLVGFGEHLRNLLVGKDERTLGLLEVGDGIRARYREQGTRCSVGFLLKALEISNQCDIDYKGSNNKKLHLELALMRMCALNGKYAIPETTGRVAEQGHTQASANHPHVKTNTPKPSVAQKPASKPQVSTSPSPAPESKPEEIKKAEPADSSASKPTMPNLPGTTSIKRPVSSAKSQKEKDDANAPEGKPAEAFTLEQLIAVWKEMIEQFRNDKNFFATLSRYAPELEDGSLIRFLVDNKVQQNELEERKGEILPYVREKLKNYKILLSVRVNTEKKDTKPYKPQDKYNSMVQKNPALKTMKEQLNLEIDF